MKPKTVSDYVIFSSNGVFIVIWRAIHTISCLLSCYFYVYLSAFGLHAFGDDGRILDFVFEGIFVISMILEFLTAYKP